MKDLDILGDKIKAKEQSSEPVLSANKPWIVRLDGNSFSKFTIDQKFTKPFDPMFQSAMIEGAKSVMNYCSEAKFVYTQSDEITIVIYNPNPEASPFLGGRVQKITSLLSNACAMGFNKYLLDQTGKFPGAMFDCRVFEYDLSEVTEPFVWRQADCTKNCISSILYWGLIQDKKISGRAASRQMDTLSSRERVSLIETDLNIDMKTYDLSFLRGVGLYKVIVEKPLGDLPEEIRKFNEGKSFVLRKEYRVNKELPLFKADENFIKQFLK